MVAAHRVTGHRYADPPMDDLRSLPKVVLHDHLDGGLRPQTVIDLAREIGYGSLPATDAVGLGRWFHQGMASSLEAYLDAFRHTAGVMQTPEGLRRVAREAIEDHAAEGVVYAEIRFAPSLHTRLGLTRPEVIEAVLAGLGDGSERHGVGFGVIVDALRQLDDSLEVVAAAARFVGRGVVAFDLAGPERGFPASSHAAACRLAVEAGLHLTIHAGEGDGVPSIVDALSVGAERIGHGVRIVEDASVVGGRITSLGPVGTEVRDRPVPLEVCPTSNLHTGMFPSPGAHPVGLLHRAGFTVTLNTDNRLMSGTSMTDEFRFVVDHQGFALEDLARVTLSGVDAAFCSEDLRSELRERVVRGYA
jgi:adenosine deaminase